ncbi:ASCH domain-containing protein [Mesorhizobium loti]|nr:ASCH domain-containing protein [Mesorhizobium loti]PLP58493.1 ASCH domain-containing protein [Mesorhizobium loti]
MSAVADPYASAVTFAFGDSPELQDELLALVLAGRKTATCGALRDFGVHEPVPVVGRRDVVLDGQGRRAAVIETMSVEMKRFDEVDAGFARDEGEGDLSYDYWREAHEAYFARNGGYSPEMILVCERFRLVEVLDRNDTKRVNP